MKEEHKTFQDLLAQDAVLTDDEWDQLMLGIMNVAEENPEDASKLYRAAYAKVQNWEQLSMIANDVSIILNDKEWGKELCDEVVEKVEGAVDYALIGGIISDSDGLNDKKLGKFLCGKAVEKAETALEYCIIAEIISHPDGLNDKSWARDIFQIALDKADTEDMKASVIDSMEDYLEV